MADWTSVEDLVSKMNLRPPNGNFPSLLDELKDKLMAVHPDRNGGDFPTAAAKAEFLQLQSAIDYIESIMNSETALVPINQVTALVKAFAQSLAIRENQGSIEAARNQALSDIGRALRKKHHGPKITSGALLAASTALFVFLGSFEDNPVLGSLLEYPFFNQILLAAWLTSGGLFLIFWYREGRVEAQAEYLLSDEALSEIFPDLCMSTEYSRHKPGTFTARNFAEVITDWWNQKNETGLGRRSVTVSTEVSTNRLPHRLIQGRSTISQAIALRVAHSQIAKLIERHAVRKLEEPDVTDRYEIDPSLRSRY